jgi:hypoxanthine-guanine phosphoribosyltransferase
VGRAARALMAADLFVVEYITDYAEEFCHLPYIGVVE